MKKCIYSLVAILGILPANFGVLTGEAEAAIGTEKVSIEYGRRRPFSFYYPYNYQYYTPHRHYSSSSNACYWSFINGTYVYMCY